MDVERVVAVVVAGLGISLALGGCASPSQTAPEDEKPMNEKPATDRAAEQTEARLLDPNVDGWTDANRAAINAMLAEQAAKLAHRSAGERVVAVFDWDNTVIKNDVGDATMEWMIDHNLIAQPPAKDWSKTNPALTEAATAALSAACDAAGDPGEWLQTAGEDGPNACGREIWSIYSTSQTTGGDAAWTDETTETMNQPYAWVAQLQAGHTPEEVRAFATEAFEERLEAPVDSGRYIRIYEPMRDLIGALQANGVEVWVVTASPQYVVDPIAERAGVPSERVVGIRNVLADGKLTYGFQGCGPVANNNATMMTYDVGKRCWINKEIFDLPADAQMSIPDDPSRRPVFVAGDSDTDIGMLVDATDLRLVIDRHKGGVMCLATANGDGTWLIQPMFIEPKAQRSAAYQCSETD
jgi:phosphoglycolate phosphatase-like HAD superfamily hydrolase